MSGAASGFIGSEMSACSKLRKNGYGFTLVELVLVILITGILITLAFRSAVTVSETAKVEQTKEELEALAYAIVGNPELQNNGVRTDFGYVGDIGAMPPNLDALVQNPGGYSTWNGPYIKRRFEQAADDFKKDAWGKLYQYTGVTIASTTGTGIVRKLANSTADLLQNQVRGVVYDLDGTPPGATYKDSVRVRLTVPDGAGGMLTRTTTPDAGGYFTFDSIPIGNHDLEIIYLPDSDTLKRFVSVLPNSTVYGEYYLGAGVWESGASGGLVLVPGSQRVFGGQCDKIEFDIRNATDTAITITSIQLTWSSPTAYYKEVKINGEVFDQDNPRAGSGDVANFTSPRTIAAGATETVRVEGFRDTPTGNGNKVDMSNVSFTVTFSDGSSFVVVMGAC
jgi:type II secretory pathway pseudopilin PulG